MDQFSEHPGDPWKAVWCNETNKLYVGVDVKDDVRGEFDNSPNSGNYKPWHDDSIEFYTDGDHSGGEYTESYGPAQQWRVTGDNHRDLYNYPNISGIHLYEGDDFITTIQQGENGNWNCEAVFTIYDDLPSKIRDLSEGDTIGWEIRYNDSDNTEYTGTYYKWSHQIGWCYYGFDAFKYADYFGNLVLGEAILNSKPVAADDSVTIKQDSMVVIDVLENDSDPDGDALCIVSIDAMELLGCCVIESGDTTITYTPPLGFSGEDSFKYVVGDGRGGLDTGLVVVNVFEINHPPIAVDDSVITKQDSVVVIDVLVNDSDPDGDALSIVSLDTTELLGCCVIELGDTTVTYTPPVGFVGEDSFGYVVGDGQGGLDTGLVVVNVLMSNHPPIAVDDSVIIKQDSTVVIDVLVNDSDPDGDALCIVSIDAMELLGCCVIESGDTTITYTPPLGFSGEDSFKYVVGDGQGGLDTAQVMITVEPMTRLSEHRSLPKSFWLHQNYPNPFNPVTSIRYELPAAEYVVIKLYNSLGREEITLVDKIQEAGYYTIEWDGSEHATGIYILWITAGLYHKNMKMVLLK